MEELYNAENETASMPGIFRGETATGDLRIHEFRSRIFRNTRFLRVWLPPGYDELGEPGPPLPDPLFE